ncbi:hypothetical protein Tco_1200203 [Tanacetum coccineum]
MLDQTFDRLQKLVSQLELLDENLSQDDVNKKLLRSLSPELNTHAIVWRNKADLDTMSMNDLYNNLKHLLKKLNTAHGVSNASTHQPKYSSNLDMRSLNTIILYEWKGMDLEMENGHVDYEGKKGSDRSKDIKTTRNKERAQEECAYEFINEHVVENCKAMSSEEEPKVVRKYDDVPSIEEWVSDDEEEDVSQPKTEKKIVRPNDQKKEDNVNNTNNVNVASTNEFNIVGGKTSIELPFDPNMPTLEEYSIFDFIRDDEDDGAEADMNNLDTTIQVSPILTTRIHKDHPFDQVIGDLQSATQTIKMSKNLKEHGNKKDERGIMIRNKARLVAQGYTQEEGITMMKSLPFTILYGKIEEEVYVCQPSGFEDLDFPNRVYKKSYCKHTMETQKPLLKDEDGKEVDVHMYRSMIGSLMYLTSSRPDIMFAVCACARYQVNPKCKKQTVVANSITEAEYVAASSCCGQVLWIQNQLLDYGYNFMYTKIFIDNNNLLAKAFDFWSTVVAKTINGEVQLHALVDGKKIIITESSVRRDLQLVDEEDEVVHKELGDSLVRAATTASSLEAEQDIGNINKTQSKATPNESSSQGTNSGGGPRCQDTMGDTPAQTRFESVSKLSNNSPLARGNTLRSDEDSLKLKELMELCTNLQNTVLDLEQTKTTQQNEITKSSDNKESLGEDASKQGRIDAIDADDNITLVSDHYVDVLDGEEVFGAEKEVVVKGVKDGVNVVEEVVEVINTAKLIIDAAQVRAASDKVSTASAATTVSAATTTTVDDITLAQAVADLKSIKPKVKGIVIQEPGESTTTRSSQLSSQQSQDKAEFDEEERLAREKAKKEQEANIALIDTWDDIQAKIDADHQLAERLQAQEQEELFIEERAKLFQQLLEKRRKHFAAKREEEKTSKSPTKSQQRKIIAFKRVNTFEDFRTELVEGKEKREGAELEQEVVKKQKVEDDKETTELRQLMEIDPDEKEVAIDAIPLAVKPPKIMLKSFDREDLEDLYKLVKAKYGSTRPVEDIDLLLWGDLKTMFEPHIEEVWRNQQEYTCWIGSCMTLVEYIP